MHQTIRNTLMSLLITLLSVSLAQTLTILTHDSFNLSEDILNSFTEQTGITLEFLPAGDAGEVVNRAILTKANPLADLLYGIDNSLFARAVNEDLFVPYQSPNLANVDARFVFDSSGQVTPVDVGFVNFNVDKAFFEAQNLALPADLSDLTQEAYRGLTVVMNPATSSPGTAFLLATVARFGTEGEYTWLHFWQDLRANDVQVTSGWSDGYYTSFSQYGGDRPIVLSYASSPAAEVMFAEEALDEAPTANVFCEACVYQQIEAIGILKGTEQLEAAQAFIDFMLSDAVQADIPPNMFVYPVVNDVPLPDEFNAYGQIPSETEIAVIDPETTEAMLSTWLDQWTQIMEQGRDASEVQ